MADAERSRSGAERTGGVSRGIRHYELAEGPGAGPGAEPCGRGPRRAEIHRRGGPGAVGG